MVVGCLCCCCYWCLCVRACLPLRLFVCPPICLFVWVLLVCCVLSVACQLMQGNGHKCFCCTEQRCNKPVVITGLFTSNNNVNTVHCLLSRVCCLSVTVVELLLLNMLLLLALLSLSFVVVVVVAAVVAAVVIFAGVDVVWL